MAKKKKLSFEEERKKKKRKSSYLDIDVSLIYSELRQNFKRFDADFLVYEVQEALQDALISKTKPVCTRNSEAIDTYFDMQAEKFINFKREVNKFPFCEFFINNDCLYLYEADCLIERKNRQFALLFAVRLSTVDLMKLRAFLDYQLNTSFSRKLKDFESFLFDLFISYSGIIPEERRKIAGSFLKDKNKTNEEKMTRKKERSVNKAWSKPETKILTTENSTSNSPSNKIIDVPHPPVSAETVPDQTIDEKEITTQRQCLALYYILRELKVIDPLTGDPKNNSHKKDIYNLTQLLTGKNFDNVKKYWNSMLGKNSEHHYKENLRFIRPFFERLHLQSIVDAISKDVRG